VTGLEKRERPRVHLQPVGVFRGIVAHLGAVGLIFAASLPGHLQLVHRHAGGEHAHLHADAAALAAHDLLAEHEARSHGHDHTHAHPHPRPADEPRHHDGDATDDGPGLWAVPDYHVHGLNPFQQVARPTPPAATLVATVAWRETPPARTPASRPLTAARSRGPPTPFVG
jgi:hypothetical protein